MPKGKPKNGINKGWIKKGQQLSKETRDKMSKAKKGKAPHDFNPSIISKMVESAKIRAKRELGKRYWKGSRKDYMALHHLIRSKFGKPNKCEDCKRVIFLSRNIHWANKRGNYSLERKDWKRLCVECHFNFDRKKHGTK